VIEAASPLSSGGFVAAGADSDYFSSDRHYESLARRMVAALRDRGRFVLVTGDPLPNPQVLSRALNKVVGFRYTVIVIPCGPQLTCDDLERAVPIFAGPRATSAAVVEPEYSVPSSPLFVFDNFDRLSDRQIKDVCEATLHREQMRASGVLLAPSGFLTRLERPALHFLEEHLAAQVCVHEFGDSEAIAFLHHQLLAQRDRRIEARGFRRGILTALAACGVVAAAIGGAFVLLHSNVEQVRETPAGIQESGSIHEPASVLRSPQGDATTAVPAQLPQPIETKSDLAAAPPPPSAPPFVPTEGQGPLPVAPPAVADVQPDPGLSASETRALVTRGDAFRSAGDITSARLYYERAADAGSGPAALQLGATFDPVILGRVDGRLGLADRAQALLWYRRARDLGMVEAEREIKRIETSSLGAGQSAPFK
jgi:hypothetical protein